MGLFSRLQKDSDVAFDVSTADGTAPAAYDTDGAGLAKAPVPTRERSMCALPRKTDVALDERRTVATECAQGYQRFLALVL